MCQHLDRLNWLTSFQFCSRLFSNHLPRFLVWSPACFTSSAVGRNSITGLTEKAVMKCELRNLDHCGHESRLCEPCTEAIVRLWTIANNTCSPTGAGEAVAGRSKSQRAAMFAKLPIAALR